MSTGFFPLLHEELLPNSCYAFCPIRGYHLDLRISECTSRIHRFQSCLHVNFTAVNYESRSQFRTRILQTMRLRRKNGANSQSVGYPIRTIAVNRGKDLASHVQRCPLLPQMLKAAGWKENRGLGVEEQVWVWVWKRHTEVALFCRPISYMTFY